jgi:hypothetical protein
MFSKSSNRIYKISRLKNTTEIIVFLYGFARWAALALALQMKNFSMHNYISFY